MPPTVAPPAGSSCGFDPDGKEFTLVSMGYRNEYDIDVSPEGDLFTYDADMEWDVGFALVSAHPGLLCRAGQRVRLAPPAPANFRRSTPTRCRRRSTSAPGSPTGVTFGTGAKFPEKFQRAFFIADWSYGMIYAVTLEPNGGGYKGTAEIFCAAQPLPVTDMVIRPQDGALYFAIGGRKAQSGLYRVTYTGSESTAAVKPNATILNDPTHKLRRSLEALYGSTDSKTVLATAWPNLDHADRFVRFAARTAIELQPVGTWRDKALAETRPRAVIEAMVALARVSGKETASAKKLALLPKIVDRLMTVDYPALDEQGKVALLRAYDLAFTRLTRTGNLGELMSVGDATAEPLGRLDAASAQKFGTTVAIAQAKRVGEKLLPYYTVDGPGMDAPVVRQELARLMCFTEVPTVIERTLNLLARAGSQEEQIHYAYCLRTVGHGWSDDERQGLFRVVPFVGRVPGREQLRGLHQKHPGPSRRGSKRCRQGESRRSAQAPESHRPGIDSVGSRCRQSVESVRPRTGGVGGQNRPNATSNGGV